MSRPLADQTLEVYLSLSLGEKAVTRLIDRIGKVPNATILFRGIPEGETVPMAMRRIARLSEGMEPRPRVVIDPKRFRENAVTVVPTVVVKQQTRVVLKLAGATDLGYLADVWNRGIRGNQGNVGPVEIITEPDLVEQIKKRFEGIDWSERVARAPSRYWARQHFHNLPGATVYRERLVDPTVYVAQDHRGAEGKVFARAGQPINPLLVRSMDFTLLVFNPTNEKEIQQVERWMRSVNGKRPILLATQFPSNYTFTKLKELDERLRAAVFPITRQQIERFGIRHTPSLVTSRGTNFLVIEQPVEMPRVNGAQP
jgi:conjugal transfer pilus assembly protein TraW